MSKPIFLALSVAFTALTSTMFAASATWSATPTDSNWVTDNTETNWSTGVGTFPGSTSSTTNTDTATFAGASTILAITINSATLNIKNITFSGSAEPAYTIGTTGGNSLLLTSGGAISILSSTTGASIANTVNAPLVLEPATATTAGTYSFSNTSGTASHPLVIGGTVQGGTTSQGIALTLTGSNPGANTVSGAISDGGATLGLSVTKASTGTWTLSGPNTYSGGTTVSGGSLLINNTSGSGTGSGSVTVSSGSLFGTGSITMTGTSRMTVASGATFSPGSGSAVGTTPGTFSISGPATPAVGVSTLSLASTSNYVLNIASGSSFDVLNLTGTINVTGSNLVVNIAAGFEAAIGSAFLIVNNDGVDPVVGLFSQAAVVAASNGQTFSISYTGNDGNDILLTTLTAIPEPSTYVMVALGAALLMLARSARRKRA